MVNKSEEFLDSKSLHENNQLLTINNLKVYFDMREGLVRAVNGVNLNIFHGENIGLVGESGCGKSVLSQSILRIVPEPGEIVEGNIFFKKNIRKNDEEIVDIVQFKSNSKEIKEIRRNNISIIFQEPMTALSPVHTIANQIIEAIRLSEKNISKKLAREKAVEILDMVGIPEPEKRIDSYTFEFSGGMRQRAMIAMALASDPDFLIADEPTTAIDVTIQAQILNLLKNLQEDIGLTTMIITHDLGVIAAITNRIAIMYLGKIVEIASKKEIFNNPAHPYTKGLIESIPKLDIDPDKELETIKGSVPHPYHEINGCPFYSRCESSIQGKCNVKPPDVIDITSTHSVSCFLYSNESEVTS